MEGRQMKSRRTVWILLLGAVGCFLLGAFVCFIAGLLTEAPGSSWKFVLIGACWIPGSVLLIAFAVYCHCPHCRKGIQGTYGRFCQNCGKQVFP
jgi:hypothetical protein